MESMPGLKLGKAEYVLHRTTQIGILFQNMKLIILLENNQNIFSSIIEKPVGNTV
jgi:hypothetical protein|tara:strand:- start:227 stop:391 length:165 start_codon:yes stop_codon:yes gene_type:complete